MFSRTCKHPKHAHITDVHEATIICSECALVINDQLNNYDTCFVYQSEEYVELYNKKNIIYDKLSEWTHRLLLENNILKESFAIYTRKYSNKLVSVKNDTIEKYLALSIYESILNNNILITLDEVLQFCNLSYREVWKIAKSEEIKIILSHQISSKQYIQRYYEYFNIPTSELESLYNINNKYDIYETFSPKTRAALCIYEHIKSFPNASPITLTIKIMNKKTLTKICNILKVSHLSILRLENVQMRDRRKKEINQSSSSSSFFL